jgi:hypothetical protein
LDAAIFPRTRHRTLNYLGEGKRSARKDSDWRIIGSGLSERERNLAKQFQFFSAQSS